MEKEKLVKAGTKVVAFLFGGTPVTGKVTRIEQCECGEKYGDPIDSVSLEELQNSVDYSYTLDLDCGHWCYGYQVKNIMED